VETHIFQTIEDLFIFSDILHDEEKLGDAVIGAPVVSRHLAVHPAHLSLSIFNSDFDFSRSIGWTREQLFLHFMIISQIVLAD
jgi:hypothetical protein